MEASWSLSSIPLGPAEIHWYLYVIIGSRGVRGIELALGTVSSVSLVWRSVPLVVWGSSVSPKSLPRSGVRGGTSFQVLEGFECPPHAYALGCPCFYGWVGVDQG